MVETLIMKFFSHIHIITDNQRRNIYDEKSKRMILEELIFLLTLIVYYLKHNFLKFTCKCKCYITILKKQR